MGEKAERTKEAILWEAGRLFAEKGFKEVTMSDICERTGLSRGGLYRYYSGTGQIFSEILSRQYTISERLERRESARVILEDMLRNLEEEILEKNRSLSLAIYEYASLGNEELFVCLNQRARKRWVSLIEYGMETGEFRQVDPEQVSDVILYYYQGLRMWSRVLPFDGKTAKRYGDTVRQLLGG
ncbi:MAG: TetR/AcrR family transcriptional regulator [Hungatella sp.]|nr:TetR/AcrR family transcriptional regulator [Hungatella sp.]